jgi:hypothetical protein
MVMTSRPMRIDTRAPHAVGSRAARGEDAIHPWNALRKLAVEARSTTSSRTIEDDGAEANTDEEDANNDPDNEVHGIGR